MAFEDAPKTIRWRLHLYAPPEEVYTLLSTDAGRARWWAESAIEADGIITFRFPGGETWRGRVLEDAPPERFSVEYYGGSLSSFHLEADGAGGTELLLTDEHVLPEARCEVLAGWVSVLLALKAAADFGVDLRNHDSQRTWNQGYANN